MPANYLQITARRLLRQKAFSLINILGLSTGLAACLLIYLYVHSELTYDAYNPLAGRIARVTSIVHSPEVDLLLAPSSTPLAGALQRDFPEVQAAVRIEDTIAIIRQGSEVISEKNFCYSEPAIFSIFSFSFLEGSAAGALTQPHSIALSRSMEKKYFGARQALGQTMICNGMNYRVTAVYADRPANSDLTINALMAKDYSSVTDWVLDDFTTYTYVLFRHKPDLHRFNNKLAGLAKYTAPMLGQLGMKEWSIRFQAEALTDVHFSEGKLMDTPKGNRLFNKIFSALAVFILLIALLNYINLSTARAAERMKEVGVRKVIGARPAQLRWQFLLESSLLVGIAWLIAIGLVEAGIPLFNRALSTQLSLNAWTAIILPILLFPVTVLLAGGYPAFVLSGFRPVLVLKSNSPGTAGSGKAAVLRKTFTVVQFVIALVMLAGAIIFYQQMYFMMHKDPGIDRTKIITLAVPKDSVNRAAVPAFIKALRHESGIGGVTVGSGIPTEGNQMATTTAWSNGKKRTILCNYFFIDPQFLSMLHVSLAAGRNFSDSFSTDKKEAYLVNEAFVRTMGWRSAIGQPMETGDDFKGKVIGVVKDFYFKSMHNVIEPMVMIYKIDPPLAVLLKTAPGEVPRLKQLWKSYFPSQPFDYAFMEDDFNSQYKKDRITLFLFNAFTGLAILISCLGLYGLVSLITLQRTKEIGIRKVLGASLSRLLLLLSADQLWLVGLAALIALPLAAWGAQRWLSTYAYHTSINVWMFVLPVGILLLLALAVTGYRIVRVALTNPARSLRAE